MKGIRINTACGNTGRIMDAAELFNVQPTGSSVPRNIRQQRSPSKCATFSSLHYKAKVRMESCLTAVPKNELDDIVERALALCK